METHRKMFTPVEKKKTSRLLNSSSRLVNSSLSEVHPHTSLKPRWSFMAAEQRSFVINGSRPERSTSVSAAPRPKVRMLDSDGDNITPLPLYQAEPGDMQCTPGIFFLDEISSSGSDRSISSSAFALPLSSSFIGGTFLGSQPSSLSTKASLTKETESSVPTPDIQINPAAPYVPEGLKGDDVKQHVTEEMLDEVVDISLSETDSVLLLDMPSTFVPGDTDDAAAIKERNTHYAELCKNRMGNDKYVGRAMQTLDAAPKEKQTQCDKTVMLDEGMIATIWDIYDSICGQNETPESESVDSQEIVNASQAQERRSESSSSTVSTVDTGSTICSLLEIQMCVNGLNTEPDLQQIMLSESFQQSLLKMERSILGNIFQPELAVYKWLPLLEDPYGTVKAGTKEQSKEGEESSSSPSLERVWALSCKLTRGHNITSMAWNRQNPDILAVGHGNFDSSNDIPGLICCWSLKNPTWPERVFHCQSSVRSLDFSADNPNQLAVGMYNGTIALYDVQSQDDRACIANSSGYIKEHLKPVWQVSWTKQAMRSSGEDRTEALVSVSEDGRISKWFLNSNGLNCKDLMRLKRTQKKKKKLASNVMKMEAVLATYIPGLCVDFHPVDSGIYLATTWEGVIHKCSSSSHDHFLSTYRKHTCPVNHVEWSPFSPDVFLSCSSDWTIQLWKQDRSTPVMSFVSSQKAVYTAKWSPNCPTIFAAINGGQMEIWDLRSSILFPTIVHQAAPGVKMTALLFAKGTDCILVGDSDGEVTVYRLKNFRSGQGKQEESLENIIESAFSS